MIIGINSQNEIVAVGEIPSGLTIIEVANDTFGEQEPTLFKIKIGGNWQEITPRYPTQGL